jgi:hypothetical protein
VVQALATVHGAPSTHALFNARTQDCAALRIEICLASLYISFYIFKVDYIIDIIAPLIERKIYCDCKCVACVYHGVVACGVAHLRTKTATQPSTSDVATHDSD